MQAVTPPIPTLTAARTSRRLWASSLARGRWLIACVLVPFGLLACGGGNNSVEPPTSTTAMIDAAGGTLTGPDGVQVIVPAGALVKPTLLGIARTSAGAPSTLPEDYAGSRPTYEFTPHDVVFNTPVTIRMPAPGSTPGTDIFMASPGGDWQLYDSTVSGGFAEWQRNSFSWGIGPFVCAPSNSSPYSASNPDPYPCSQPRGYATASATPSSAIIQQTVGNPFGSAGSWLVNQAGTVTLTLNYQAAPDCENPRAKLLRWNPADPLNTPNRVKTLFDGPVVLTPTTLTQPLTSGGGTYLRGVGSTRHDVAFSHLDNGTSAFGFSFSCNRPFRTVRTGGDLLTFVAAVPVPPVSYTIGGTASGLTGTGLVLQNNGGDNLAVSASPFTFAGAVGAGAPYSVTVLTQPTGQTCSVTNGAGTANANVTNVALNCVTSAIGTVSYTIGGSVNGLTGTGLVLQNNGGDNLAVSASPFTFAGAISAGAPYSVTVLTQPTGQTCSVTNGAGTANANVTNVALNCVTSVLGNWGAAVAITAVGKSAGEPALGASVDGNATLAWVQYDTDQYNGYASRFDTVANDWQGGELIENLNTNTAQSTGSGVYSPRVAMSASQRAHIVFGFSAQPTSYQIAMSRYTGSGWASQLLTSGGNSNDASLSFSAGGNTALMMYSQYDGTKYAIRSQAYQYGSDTLATLSPDGGIAGSSSYSASAALGSGEAVGSWIGQGKFVYVNRFDGATQTWGAPVNLNASSTGNAYAQAIAGNAAGNAAVVWLDLNSGYRIYASRLSSGTWSTPEALATQAEGAPRNFDSSGISVATGLDSSGNAYFAWGQEDLASPYTTRLYVRRCAIGQAMSACDSRVQMDNRNDRVGRPGLAVGPNGDVWVAWVARTTTGSEVRARRRDSAGWSAVVTVGSSLDTDVAPSIVVDGLNRVTLAWAGADNRIYVARHQ